MVACAAADPSASLGDVPEWVHYPGETWETLTPGAAGLDEAKFSAWVDSRKPRFGKAYGGQQPEHGGVVIARGGYLLRTWGDPDFRYQSASLAKTFTRMALQLAVDEGLIGSVDDPVIHYWTGEGHLASHKVLDRGHHRTLTFRHLQDMRGGFPVTNGYFWRTGRDVPNWADRTKDPSHDNYAHVEPGTRRIYSSGGYWRLSQALTFIWGQDLKTVLDERIMGRVGIPSDRWDWLTGETVRHDVDFYPDMPGYGDFLDPPYTFEGSPVRGGGGWAVMSASDFARLGLLVATRGIWKGERLISKLGGNVGVAANTLQGWGAVDGSPGYFSFGKVATGFDDPTPEEMASWVVGPVEQSDR